MDAPFMQRDADALNSLHIMHLSGQQEDAELLDKLNNQAWFEDGLDDLEAALIYAIHESRGLGAFTMALVEEHYVVSTTIELPLSGSVGLAVVSQTPILSDDDTLATLDEGLRAMEGFMEVPLPLGDVILLLVEPEFWNARHAAFNDSSCSGSRLDQCYLRSILWAENPEEGPSREALLEVIGEYYAVPEPWWLNTATARFLKAHVEAEMGGESLEERLASIESDGVCGESLWLHISLFGGRDCDQLLGERFLLGINSVLGAGAVSGGLRELYGQRYLFLDHSEDHIFYAFLKNVPEGNEEEFRAVYRQYHGGPIADQDWANSPDLPPLLALYDATLGENWLYSRNWASDAPPGAWYGVSTDAFGRAVQVELFASGLAGDIPPELGGLAHLTKLSLGSNRLTGTIPPELGNLTSLLDLDLRANRLVGEIPPQFGRLVKLEILELQGNDLTGEIPAELGNLVKLRKLDVSGNFFSGEIPSELANLVNLRSLDLGVNEFTGCIAEELPEIWVEKSRLARCTTEAEAGS